jgi:hypothetical protein
MSRAFVNQDTFADEGRRAPVEAMALESNQVLEGGAVWLRYRPQNG